MAVSAIRSGVRVPPSDVLAARRTAGAKGGSMSTTEGM